MNFRMKSFFSPPSAESSTPASSGRDYEKKNKLMEKKSWAKTAISKCMQARFICLAHNLMTLFEHVLDREEGITDETVHAKRRKRSAEVEASIRERGGKPNSLVAQHAIASQRSLQFIRWLRYILEAGTSWRKGVELSCGH
ncbi:MAG: hypothetical protein ACI97B_003271 [Verrucomicrobiales bacterium]|jgi:hypothetical protein